MAKNRVAPENQSEQKFRKVNKTLVNLKKNHKTDTDIFKPNTQGQTDFFVIANSKTISNQTEKHALESSNNTEQQSFPVANKLGNSKQNKDVVNEKKPFNKKEYRFKKYNKKYKLQQWEDKRKKNLLHEYHQSIKDDDQPKFDVKQIYEKYDEDLKDDNNSDGEKSDMTSKKKKKLFLKPHEKYQQIKQEKQRKHEENIRKRAEREEAVKKARKERFERNKLLSRKTKKGQPIMKYRIEMLLDKIEKSMKN